MLAVSLINTQYNPLRLTTQGQIKKHQHLSLQHAEQHNTGTDQEPEPVSIFNLSYYN